MGIIGFVATILGLALSVVALVQAGSAKKAVNNLLGKSSDQTSRDSARDILAKLAAASEAAMARRNGAAQLLAAGRELASDVQSLQRAQDALATITVGTDALLEKNLRIAAQELDRALAAIAVGGERDGWADALGAIQGVVSKLDKWQRSLGVSVLAK